MIGFADDMLGRGGRLNAALREHYRLQAPICGRISWPSCAATAAVPRSPISRAAIMPELWRRIGYRPRARRW